MIEDEELRNLYKISGEECLQKLEAGLLHLQKHPLDEATLERLRREAHSLKGDSKIVGVENVVTLTHQVEEILLSIKASEIIFTSNVSDRLYQGLDAIGLLVYEAVTGESSGVDTAEILDQLMQVFLESKLHDTGTEVASIELSPIVATGLENLPTTTLPLLEVFPEAEQDPQTLLEQGNQFTTTTPLPQINRNAPEPGLIFIEDEELRDIYQVASEEHLDNLANGLQYLQKHPSDEAILEQLLREAHSLKGDSRSIGVENVITLTHQVEEIFLGIKAREIIFSQDVCDRLYQALDAIGLLVYEAVTGDSTGVDTAEILDQLLGAVSTSTIQESLPLPTEIPVKTATKLEKAEIGQPYHIDTIRVQTRHFDALMSQAEELTLTKTAIAHAATEIEAMATLWEEWKAVSSQEKYLDSSFLNTNPYAERLEKTINSLRTSTQENSTKLDIIVGELREKIYTLRLVPLSTVFQLLPRIVRDLARQQSKQVELIIEGGETTADKRILEEIKDSLMHMVRNAIDHGIETPAEREKLGKRAIATIWLRGYRTATNIIIELADDGRGLDIEKIKQTAVKRGLYSPEELAIMTPSQIYPLILASGFSTRTFITEISGRGIGLDVVRTSIERLQGNIQIESTPGQGCTFRIQLNTTLGIINVVLLEVEGIVHAVPIEFVQKTLLISQEQIYITENRVTIDLDGQTVSVANLGDLLELSNSPAFAYTAKEQQNSRLRPCILLKVGEEQFGLFVDRNLHTQEIVIKPQSQLLKRVRNVMGATILGSGEVCMILNPPDLLKSLQQQNTSVVSIKPRKTIQRKRVILLVEDSIPVRTQEKRLLEKAGYEVVIAVDGLDGYNKLKTRDFDAVISDVEMPNLDGLSLTTKIRQHEEYKALPIILVTTLAADEDIARGSEAGANAYIIKGNFNQDVLLEILGKLV